MPPVTQATGPLINMKPAAMPLTATPSIMSVRPNQMGYLLVLLLLIHRALSFLTCLTPVGKLQERQKFEAWKALHSQVQPQVQPQVSQKQAPPIVSSGCTVSENVKIDDAEVISMRSASTKRARSQIRQLLLHQNVPDPVHQHPADHSLPAGTTLEATSTVTRPSQVSP